MCVSESYVLVTNISSHNFTHPTDPVNEGKGKTVAVEAARAEAARAEAASAAWYRGTVAVEARAEAASAGWYRG